VHSLTDVHLKYINAVHVKVVADASIIMELSDAFTFMAPNYLFNPKYKARVWDGKIRLVNNMTGYMYAGLAKKIKKFCDVRGYSFSFDEELTYENVSEHEVKEFIKTLGIPEKYESRDYQIDSIVKCLRAGRRTLVSPTSSGKSFMIYVLMRWYQQFGHKGLIIVPTIGLVNQMESDFREYGYDGNISLSTHGIDRSDDISTDMVITTWQSLNNGKTKMHKSWYAQFGCVFGDEAHGAKATSLIQILSGLEGCKYRFGTTGTLDGDPLNETTIEGLFGPKYKAVTTKQLMESGHVSKLKIKCIVLRYPEEITKQLRGKTYQEEIDFIVNHEPRNKFLKNLTLSLTGNKLLFFRIIDHGKALYQLIQEASVDNVFYIDGGVDGNTREEIRKAIEDEHNATLIASLGTTSTGVSINKLHHMIAASPSKSKIKVLQSIGRMLRMHAEKEEAILYDIVDDMSIKSHQNFTLKHFIERCQIYDAEKFDYEIYNVRLK
jgi:superfamily II DNA or RNA helicase